jgi:hypothetical protein
MHKPRADWPDHAVSYREHNEDKSLIFRPTDGPEPLFPCPIMGIIDNKQRFREECLYILGCNSMLEAFLVISFVPIKAEKIHAHP